MTAVAVRKFNPAQPRDPGGEGGGRWITGGGALGAVVDALKKLGGDDGGGIYFDDDTYIDWHGKYLEATDLDGETVQLDLGDTDLEGLHRALTLTRLRGTGSGSNDEQSLMLSLLGVDAGGDQYHFEDDDDKYLDWSVRDEDGSYQVEIGDAFSDEAIRIDMTPEQFAAWHASLALTVMKQGKETS